MTGNLVIDLAVSLAGVFLLAGLAVLWGGGKPLAVTQDNASRRLAFDEPDFTPIEWFISSDGKAALAWSGSGSGSGSGSETGEAALVFALGDGLASRRFAPGDCVIDLEGAGLSLKLADHTLPRFSILPPDDEAGASAENTSDAAALWARRLRAV